MSNPNFNAVAAAKVSFSGPLGPMLGEMGILTPAQQQESGEVQAQMIAIRTAAENAWLSFEEAKVKIGEARGTLDFGNFSKKTSAERQGILVALKIDEAQLQPARVVVQQAQATRSNVNAGHAMQVSPIGFIHTDLHAKNIPGFALIKEGALIVQRAIDSVEALERLQAGKPDAASGAKRGFRLFGDESPALKQVITDTQELNEREVKGDTRTYDTDIIIIEDQFNYAALKFAEAGQGNVAEQLKQLKANLITQKILGAVIRTPAGQGETPGPAPLSPQ